MRILVASPTFAPLIGGLPTVSDLLATGLTSLGEDVTVVTSTPAPDVQPTPYRVLRAPSASRLIATVVAADVALHNTVSLRLGWPLALVRRPLVVAHHMWLDHGDSVALLVRAKRAVIRRSLNIAVSDAVARSIDCPSTVIANPYDESVFRMDVGVPRSRDLVFVGRLLADKGLHVALAALAKLRGEGCTPTLSVIGSGPEEPALRALCSNLGLDTQASFLGPLRGPALASALNRHRILLVPSVWEEPFGIVALEGIACGLVPIVSRSGGLPAAVGSCGAVVPKADPAALATTIRWLCENTSAYSEFRSGATVHLARHTRIVAAAKYLTVLRQAIDSAR